MGYFTVYKRCGGKRSVTGLHAPQMSSSDYIRLHGTKSVFVFLSFGFEAVLLVLLQKQQNSWFKDLLYECDLYKFAK